MKRNCKFEFNPAYRIGIISLCIGLTIRSVLEPEGILLNVSEFACGLGCGGALLGLLYGSPKTKPLFDRFCAFIQRLLGRE